MLKLKDDVNLKELEKFGFKEMPCLDNSVYKLYRKCIGMTEYMITDFSICVEHTNIGKIIKIYSTGNYKLEELDVLYDLIQANMLEKVEE